jgi:Asp-tRNAAsn/Glu-tRNAGln amidotransferase A subunit and related amidases
MDQIKISLENSIMVKGSPAAAGSKILENFISPLDAEVVERLRNAGMEITVTTDMKEFGISGVIENDVIKNTAVPKLCNDLFGQYRRDAAESGLCYIHPTYGTVSRYGLIPMASSMDQIGVMCENLTDGFKILSVIAGNDPKDGAMYPDEIYKYENIGGDIKIGVPNEIINKADTKMQNAIREFVSKFAGVDCELNYFDVCPQVMYILSSAEISNNISRYDGVKFGYRSPDATNLESLYEKTRTEGFGIETKLAAIMGSMVLSADKYEVYYEKAMKVRRLVKESLSFDNYDLLILPVSISGSSYENLALYSIATLAGLPSVSFEYNGAGIQLIAKPKNENALLTAWEAVKQ